MKKTILIVLSLLACIFYSAAFLSNTQPESEFQTYELKYNMSQGSKFTITYTDNFGRTTFLADGDVTGNTIDDSYGAALFIKSVNNTKGMVLETEITKASRLSTNPGGTRKIDFKELIGKKVELSLSPAGEFSGTGGFNELPGTEQIMRRTAPDHLIHRLSMILPKLPGKNVAVGETWFYTLEEEYPGYGPLKTKINSSYTFKLLEEVKYEGFDCLKIQGEYTCHSLSEGEMRGQPIKTEYKGTGNETIYFAYKKGMLLQKEGTYKHSGTFQSRFTSEQEDEVKYSVKVAFEK